MPSSATITTFYSFTQNTRARASEVNTNFSIFRGHIIPVDPNTSTGSNLTYSLGSSEWRWLSGYFDSVFLGRTTTSWQIADDTTTSATNKLVFKSNGTNAFVISANPGITITASIGQIARSLTITASRVIDPTAAHVANSTITLSTIGRPVILNLIPVTSASSIAAILIGNNASSNSMFLDVSLVRSGTTISSHRFGPGSDNNYFNDSWYVPGSLVSFIDVPSSGTYNYYLSWKMSGSTNTGSGQMTFLRLALQAFEL